MRREGYEHWYRSGLGDEPEQTIDVWLVPKERRAALAQVCIRQHFPDGVRKTTAFGMIDWEVSLARDPHAYKRRDVMRIGFAPQHGDGLAAATPARRSASRGGSR